MPTLNINGNIRTNTAAGWAADATVYTAKTILVTTDATYGATDQRKFKIADGTQTWSNLDYFPVSGYDDATSSIQTQLNAKLTSDNIVETITNGVTTNAPSENAVYDALLLKQSLSINIGSHSLFSPTDSTTTYVGPLLTAAPNASAATRPFRGVNGTITSFWVWVDPTGVLGSNEDVIFNLYNITDAVVVGELGRMSFDARGNAELNTGLSLATLTTKFYSIEMINPAWATNPTNVAVLGKIIYR